MTRIVVGNTDISTGAAALEVPAMPIVQTVNEEAAESAPQVYYYKGVAYERTKYIPYLNLEVPRGS